MKVNLVTKRIRASSLIEVITAMVLISITFSIAILIYLNVQKSGFTYKKVKADIYIQEVITNTKQKRAHLTFEQKFGDIVVYQDVFDHASVANLKIVQWQARDGNGSILCTRQILVYDSGNSTR